MFALRGCAVRVLFAFLTLSDIGQEGSAAVSDDDSRTRVLEMPGTRGNLAISGLAATLLDGIRAGRSWLQLAADLGLMPGEVYTELLPLVAARRLVFMDGEFRPVL